MNLARRENEIEPRYLGCYNFRGLQERSGSRVGLRCRLLGLNCRADVDPIQIGGSLFNEPFQAVGSASELNGAHLDLLPGVVAHSYCNRFFTDAQLGLRWSVRGPCSYDELAILLRAAVDCV